MLHRLWLTDEQSGAVVRALRNQIKTLYECADEMHTDKAYDLEEKYVNEANVLDDILDVLTED